MTSWITVIGIPARGFSDLPDRHKAIVHSADVIFGANRFLSTLPGLTAETIPWQSSFKDTFPLIETWRGKNVIVLASGDPLFYGVAGTLLRYFDPDDLEIIPSVSSISLAAAKLRWPLQDTQLVSAHAFPAEEIIPCLSPNARLLVLTKSGQTVSEIADLVQTNGYRNAELTVLENLGSQDERCIPVDMSSSPSRSFADLNILAIACGEPEYYPTLSRYAGLPDDVFEHDGQITKRDIRAITLSALNPVTAGCLWDVGAGSGSVSVEWMRFGPRMKAIAFEKNPERARKIRINATRLGVPRLEVVEGIFPASLKIQSAPDAIFIGGDVQNETIFECCWNELKPHGRLVCNAVTLDGEAKLQQRYGRFGGELLRIAISHVENIGTTEGFRPNIGVTQWRVTKHDK